MKTTTIWIRAQIINLAIWLPTLVFPPVYLIICLICIIGGLPAIPLFYLSLLAVKYLLRPYKPVNSWVAALACLPGMLLITGGCALASICLFCHWDHSWFEWGMVAFGLPSMLAVVIAVFLSRKHIHRFIYPYTYAYDTEKTAA